MANDSDSICSDKCSTKTCSDCCDNDQCHGDCPKECDGFVDCNDAEGCSELDCIEDACRDVAPPCFNSDCLQSLTVGEIAAAAHLATSTALPQSSLFMDTSWPYTSSLEREEACRDRNFRYPQSGASDCPANYLCPPLKRIKVHGPKDVTFPDGGSEAARHRQPLPQLEVDQAALLHCHWGSDCDGEFFDWSALDDHIYRTHIKPQRDFQCRWADCEQPTDSEIILNHIKRNHGVDDGEGEHICLWSGCTSRFCDGKDLEYHVQQAHVPSNSLYCQWNQCGALAQDPTDLFLHLQTDHAATPPPTLTPPDQCNTFQSQVSLGTPEAAMRACEWVDTVTERTGSASNICGESFASADELQQHTKEAHIAGLRRKSGYFCQWADCSRKGTQPFSQRGKLERHMQVHTGFKSCRCNTCGREFSAPQALQQHERTHTGEKPYKCEACGKEFAQGSALTMHRRTHTKERPLKCDFPGCKKTFSEVSLNNANYNSLNELTDSASPVLEFIQTQEE